MTRSLASPLVTVLMPARNAEAFLPSALHSLWSQTLDDFELIVVDDGSTDGTSNVLSRQTDPRLLVVPGQRDGSIAAALNTGLGLARGRFIARMDADDISVPDRLRVQLSALEGNERVGVIGSNIQFMRHDGRATSRRTHLPISPDGVRLHLHIGNCLPHPSAMLRRDVLESVGGYRTDKPAAEDYDLWLRLMARTRLMNVEACLVHYRQHVGNASTVERRSGARSVTVELAAVLQSLLGEEVAQQAVQRLLLPNEAVGDGDEEHVIGALKALAGVMSLTRQHPTLPTRDVAAVRRRHDYVAARLYVAMLRRKPTAWSELRHRAARGALPGVVRGLLVATTDRLR
jgi:GT2 family glycosyltransferase